MTTLEDAKRYCPMNSKSRGDNQIALVEDFDSGICELDHERCHFTMCSILDGIMKVHP